MFDIFVQLFYSLTALAVLLIVLFVGILEKKPKVITDKKLTSPKG